MTSSTLPLPKIHDTVVHMLAAAAADAPNHVAVIEGARTLTYAEFARCVGGLAQELVSAGGRGQRVALVLGNSLEMAVATYAVHAAGAQAVPINPIYTERELGYILRDAAPHIAILDPAVADTVARISGELSLAKTILAGGGRRTPVRCLARRCQRGVAPTAANAR